MSKDDYESIEAFRGKYWFLSNFSDYEVTYEGVIYPRLENAFQAAKTFDQRFRKKFLECTASQAKRLGRSKEMRLVMRKDWDDVKKTIMLELLMKKFVRNKELAKKLKETFPKPLVEGNTWDDTYWGVCGGVGKNWLGILLMQVRDVLVDKQESR